MLCGVTGVPCRCSDSSPLSASRGVFNFASEPAASPVPTFVSWEGDGDGESQAWSGSAGREPRRIAWI